MNLSTHDPYAALRSKSYRRYLFGNVISTLGMQMQTVAVGWEIYERTGKPLALGMVGLVQFLPMAALILPAGQVADRYDRRRLVMAAMAVTMLCSIGLLACSVFHADVRLMYLCLFGTGVARAFLNPAKSSFVPQIIEPKDFANAVTWGTSGFHLASVMGPALGGAMIAALRSATWVYAVDACAALVFVVLLATLELRPTDRKPQAITLDSFIAGLKFVWTTKIILASITLDMFAVLLGGAVALLPVFAKDILHVDPVGLGWLTAADPIGAFVMALALAYLPPIKKAGKTLLWSVVAFGAAMIVFGLSRSFWLSFVMLFVAGAVDNISVVIRGTLVQTLTPDEMRGRVSSVNSLFVGTSNELGRFESGATAALLGPVWSVVGGGIGTLLVVAVAAKIWPQLRNYGRLGGEPSRT